MNTITAYKTSDGSLFESEYEAKIYEQDLAVSKARSAIDGLMTDEFPCGCIITRSGVLDFMIENRRVLSSILNEVTEELTTKV
jgi:hypothetical protein